MVGRMSPIGCRVILHFYKKCVIFGRWFGSRAICSSLKAPSVTNPGRFEKAVLEPCFTERFAREASTIGSILQIILF